MTDLDEVIAAAHEVAQPSYGMPKEANAEQRPRRRLRAYDRSGGRHGLIHGDLHLLNLMRDGDDLWSIDYDDCGYSRLMFDIGAPLQFVPDADTTDELVDAWVDGYRREADLTSLDLEHLHDFVMLRRLLLLGWSATHPDAPLPNSVAQIVDVTATAASRSVRALPVA